MRRSVLQISAKLFRVGRVVQKHVIVARYGNLRADFRSKIGGLPMIQVVEPTIYAGNHDVWFQLSYVGEQIAVIRVA